MYTSPYCDPLHAVQYYVAAPIRESQLEVPESRATCRTVTTRVVVGRQFPSSGYVARAGTSLEARIGKPDWVRDKATYLAWRASLDEPDQVIPLPSRFKCHLCRCERSRKRTDIGIEECAWCAGEGREIQKH